MKFDLDSLKNFFGAVKEKGKEFADVAIDKTKETGRLAKLKMDQMSEKERQRKAYTELGKAYYEEKRGEAEGVFATLCEEIEAATARIDALQAEIDELKTSLGTVPKKSEAADFEAVVSEHEPEDEPDIEVEIREEEKADDIQVEIHEADKKEIEVEIHEEE